MDFQRVFMHKFNICRQHLNLMGIVGSRRRDMADLRRSSKVMPEKVSDDLLNVSLTFLRSIQDPPISQLGPFLNILEYSGTPMM